ncbi:unnamed protein product [Lathyrus sativus]|nr:unnamed protein product [Lathyrus sativus]
MSRTTNYIIHDHFNGYTYFSESSGFGFQNTGVTRLTMSRKSKFLHFKERIESKILSGPISQIIYRSLVFFENSQVKYFQQNIQDNNDVQQMFDSHEHSGFDYIERYLLLCQTQQSQMFGESQVIDQSQSLEQDEVDAVDKEEEEPEAMVDQMVNLFGTRDYTVITPLEGIDEEALPLSHMYCPP